MESDLPAVPCLRDGPAGMVSRSLDSPLPLVSGLAKATLRSPQGAILRDNSRVASVSGLSWTVGRRPAPLHGAQPAGTAAEKRRVFHAIRARHVRKRPKGLSCCDMYSYSSNMDV